MTTNQKLFLIIKFLKKYNISYEILNHSSENDDLICICQKLKSMSFVINKIINIYEYTDTSSILLELKNIHNEKYFYIIDVYKKIKNK